MAGQSEGRWRASQLALALGAGRLHMQLGTCAATRSSFVIETPCSKVRVEHVVIVEQGSHHAPWSIARLNCELLNARTALYTATVAIHDSMPVCVAIRVSMPPGYKIVISLARGLSGIYCTKHEGAHICSNIYCT